MRALMLFVLAMIAAVSAHAHEVRPSYLELTETEVGEWAVTWKQPLTNGQRLKIDPVLPETCVATEPTLRSIDGTLIKRWRVSCDLADGEISITGLSRTLTDAYVKVQGLDGTVRSSLLRSGSATLELSTEATGAPVWAYLQMGIIHILNGFDHLLFVLGLLLIVRRNQLVSTITAFTIAHSITLGLVILTGFSLPSRPVEIVIAMSIVLLGVEAVKQINGQRSLTADRPWAVAFGIGLLHGFGFAGALSDIGLPRGAELLSLGLFNLGVEVGQISFVLVLLLGAWIIRRLTRVDLKKPLIAMAYCIGIAGSYWAIERSAEAFAIFPAVS